MVVVVVLLQLVEVEEVENALLVIIDVGESWKNGEVKDGYNVIIVETCLFFVVVIVDTGNELKLVKVFKNFVGCRSKFRLCCIILRFLFSDNNNSSNNNNNSRNRRNNNDNNSSDNDNNKNDKNNIVVIFHVQPVLVMYK